MDAELHVDRVVRGHHVYKSIWTPVLGEELSVEPENGNEHDRYAMSVNFLIRRLNDKPWADAVMVSLPARGCLDNDIIVDRTALVPASFTVSI